jgi:excisionase family DNA binding protein
MLRDGRLAHVRVGGRLVRVTAEQIDRYIRENTVTV